GGPAMITQEPAAAIKTIDWRKDASYRAKAEPALVDIPGMRFVMVDGEGAPENNPLFQEAMQILYGIVYTIKFWDKKYAPPKGYAKFSITPLEGIWWSTGGNGFDANNPGSWRWTVMIRIPEFVTPTFFKQVVAELIQKKQTNIYK